MEAKDAHIFCTRDRLSLQESLKLCFETSENQYHQDPMLKLHALAVDLNESFQWQRPLGDNSHPCPPSAPNCKTLESYPGQIPHFSDPPLSSSTERRFPHPWSLSNMLRRVDPCEVGEGYRLGIDFFAVLASLIFLMILRKNFS